MLTEKDKMQAAFFAGSLRPAVSTAHAEKLFAQWYRQFRQEVKAKSKKVESNTFYNNPRMVKKAS